MKKLYVLLGAAVLVAAVVSFGWEPVPLEEKLVRIQAESAFPELAAVLKDEPVEVHAVLLDYADDKVLLLKAQAALLKYPELARQILPLYGPEPEFREALLAYGESILPPINYFMTNEVRSIALTHYTAQKVQAAKSAVGRLWASKKTPEGALDEEATTQALATEEDAPITTTGTLAMADEGFQAKSVELATSTDEASATEDAAEAITEGEQPVVAATEAIEPAPDVASALTPEQRGWYAVNFIHGEGHDFLGQFTVDEDGQTKWIQTERLLEGINSLFASGIRTLETKVQTGQEVTAGDVGWAVVDVVSVVGATYLLRAGKAAATTTKATKSTSFASRTAAFTSRVARAGRIGLNAAKYAKWPAIIATGYLVVNHPSILNDVMAGIAQVVGLPPLLVQLVGWTLILLPLFYIGSWIMRLVVRPAIAVLRWLVKTLVWLEQTTRTTRKTAASGNGPSPAPQAA